MKYKKYFRKTSLKQKGIGEFFLNEIEKKKPKIFLEVGVFHGVTARNVCELLHKIHKNDFKLSNSPVSPKNLGQLVKLISTNEISGKIAKDVLEEMFSSKKSAREIVDDKGLKQVTDQGEIENVIDEVIKDNPKIVQEYLGGKDKLLGFFVGLAMKKTKGKANPKMLNDILLKKLS